MLSRLSTCQMGLSKSNENSVQSPVAQSSPCIPQLSFFQLGLCSTQFFSKELLTQPSPNDAKLSRFFSHLPAQPYSSIDSHSPQIHPNPSRYPILTQRLINWIYIYSVIRKVVFWWGGAAWCGGGGQVKGGSPSPTGATLPWGGPARNGPCTICLQNGAKFLVVIKMITKKRVAWTFVW